MAEDQRADLDDRDTSVCASCGRYGYREAGKDCEQPDWHLDLGDDDDTPTAPVPALTGDDLARHLQTRVRLAEDQVLGALALLAAVLDRQPDRELRVTDEELLNATGRAVATWRDEGAGATVYKLGPA